MPLNFIVLMRPDTKGRHRLIQWRNVCPYLNNNGYFVQAGLFISPRSILSQQYLQDYDHGFVFITLLDDISYVSLSSFFWLREYIPESLKYPYVRAVPAQNAGLRRFR
jgi:hypothetical protein